METALYLIPVTLGDTPVDQVLPSYNRDVVVQLRHFIVENAFRTPFPAPDRPYVPH